jgi:hypothetical protein
MATLMRMGTHSTPGCSRYPAAFAERFQSIDWASYPVFSVKQQLEREEKSGWYHVVSVVVPVWRKLSRAPLRRMPFGRRVDENHVESFKLGKLARGLRVRVTCVTIAPSYEVPGNATMKVSIEATAFSF